MSMYDVGGTRVNSTLRNQSREYQKVKTKLLFPLAHSSET